MDNKFELDDDGSVGSLARTDADADVESGYYGGKRHDSSGNGGEGDSQEALVKRRSRAIYRLKWALLVLLLVGGIFLTSAAYLTSDDDTAGMKAGVVGVVAFLQLMAFLWYDHLVDKRNALLLDMTRSSRAIVDQLFPNFARDRLLRSHGSSQLGSELDDGPDEMQMLRKAYEGDLDWKKLTKRNTLHNQRMAQEGRNLEYAKKSKNRPTQIRTFLSMGMTGMPMATTVGGVDSEPIAELYENTTVMFADIAGFTSWSSEREPSQVFRLLEKVYGAFDSMAEKLKVFKVETIGDSYMCVTGLPEPDEQHAVNMSRFAYQSLVQMDDVTRELNDILGQGTEDLQMRIGLHSGPVTAGVLRGQKSRFQLFGDTVNTASRMESTSAKGRIQVSESTASCLIQAGKKHWIQERRDRVVAKGKGELRTFWLVPRRRNSNDGMEIERADDPLFSPTPPTTPMIPAIPLSGSMDEQVRTIRSAKLEIQEKKVPSTGQAITLANMNIRLKSNYRLVASQRYERLIEYNTDILFTYLQAVQDSRVLMIPATKLNMREVNHDTETYELPPPFESVADVIALPDFQDTRSNGRKLPRSVQDESSTDLDALRADLKSYVADIASMYQDVPFHNFEHASHVTLAMDKLIQRMTNVNKYTDLELHLLTFGISSDPLTQFAMVLAALIHDVGHSGITNAQLVAEEADVAMKYRERSVAEQNSLCVSWALLMHSRYKRLRSHLYKTNVERKRFRQVLINAVMATDIADREIIMARARKWNLAFQDDDDDAEGDRRRIVPSRDLGAIGLRKDERNRKATVVIEALMQVADVAHTMQQWTIWRRWNAKLFEEMYVAYMNGRASFDPTEIWLRGELAFLDHFVVPLAQKIDDCGIFGPAGDQYLEYAMANRAGWKQLGEQELAEMVQSARVIEPDGFEGHASGRFSRDSVAGMDPPESPGTESQDAPTFADSSAHASQDTPTFADCSAYAYQEDPTSSGSSVRLSQEELMSGGSSAYLSQGDPTFAHSSVQLSQADRTFAGSSNYFGYDHTMTEHSDIDSNYPTVTSAFPDEEEEMLYQKIGNPPPPPFNSPAKARPESNHGRVCSSARSRAGSASSGPRPVVAVSAAVGRQAPSPSASLQEEPSSSRAQLVAESSSSQCRLATDSSPSKRSASSNSTVMTSNHHQNQTPAAGRAKSVPPNLPTGQDPSIVIDSKPSSSATSIAKGSAHRPTPPPVPPGLPRGSAPRRPTPPPRPTAADSRLTAASGSGMAVPAPDGSSSSTTRTSARTPPATASRRPSRSDLPSLVAADSDDAASFVTHRVAL